MARVTVEDCIDKVDNRFELVMVAAQRARRIGSGAAITLSRDNDKNPVVALREIAEETIPVENLKEELIQAQQKIIENDEEDDSVIDLMDGEEEWASMAALTSASEDDTEAESDFEDEDMSDEDDIPTLEDMAGVRGE